LFSPGCGAEFTAYGVNGGGRVVGGSGSKYSAGDAVEFSNGAETVLGHLAGDDESTAYGINDAGQAVGESGQSVVAGGSAQHHAVPFSGGQVIPLGGLKGDTDSWAFAVNDSGVAVGVSQGPESSQAVLFRHGHVIDLGAPAGDLHSQALAINSDGVTVGRPTVTDTASTPICSREPMRSGSIGCPRPAPGGRCSAQPRSTTAARSRAKAPTTANSERSCSPRPQTRL
jgi:uncharacterized membrane protein